MPDEVTVTFPYSAADHADALGGLRSRRFLTLWLRFWGIVMGLALGTLLVIGPSTLDKPFLEILRQIWTGIGMAGISFFLPDVFRRVVMFLLHRRHGHEPGPELRVFSSDGFTPSADWSQPVPWAMIDKVVETTKSFLIYHAASGQPVYVPKHVLSLADERRLKSLFEEKLRGSPARLKLQP